MTERGLADEGQALATAARSALNALVVLERREPDVPPHTELASRRRDYDRRLAHRRWVAAMRRWEALLGEDFPGRDRRQWVPVCVRVLSGEGR
jgi:hypothetical protein